MLTLLRAAIDADSFAFSVVALLNAPPVDTLDAEIAVGQWYGYPLFVSLGYPTDSLIQDVINRSGHDPGFYGPDVNCFVRFDYAVPADLSAADLQQAHAHAGEYVRHAVDLLRLLHDDDIGIVHLVGFAEAERNETVLGPPFGYQYPERPNQSYRVPLRRVYDAPSGTAMTMSSIEEFAALFEKSLSGLRIAGLPVAMERLRGIFDRYAPDEIGRIVDAVTGLEALYLPEKGSELKFRLQTRAAWFLGADGNDRVMLAKELGDVYDARSALVHSGELTSRLKGRDKALMQRAVTMLRHLRGPAFSDHYEGESAAVASIP